MGYEDDDAFGGFWDLGDEILTDLISFPIKAMIKRDARRAGIDLDNPRRKMATAVSSIFMTAALGTFLGPFGAILGGALGFATAIGAEYPDDKKPGEREAEDQALCALKLKAFGTAAEIMKEHTTRDTWNDLADEVNGTIKRLQKQNPRVSSPSKSFDIYEKEIVRAIEQCDYNVYRNFMKVYQEARIVVGV